MHLTFKSLVESLGWKMLICEDNWTLPRYSLFLNKPMCSEVKRSS